MYELYTVNPDFRCQRSINTHTHTHTRPFNGPLSRTTLVSRYQKGKTNLDFTEARGSEWQWHQWGHVQVCISLQTDNHASTPPLKFFTVRMPFLPPNQQRQNLYCIRLIPFYGHCTGPHSVSWKHSSDATVCDYYI